MEIVENFIKEQFTEISWFVPAFATTIILFVIILCLFILYKFHKGTISINFLGFKTERNKTYEELQKQFSDLDAISEVKSNTLKLLNQTILTFPDWYFEMDNKNFEQKVQNFYKFLLPGILSLITKEKHNTHRIAIFTKRENNYLKILHGVGYSPNGLQYLELGLDDSKAGYSFVNNKQYYNPDITNDPTYVKNPKSSKEYKSLLCIPILYGKSVIGILNIDGALSHSFDKDDINYITYFANALAPLLYMELNYLSKKNIFEKEEAIILESKRSG